jgi:hypothetical protein
MSDRGRGLSVRPRTGMGVLRGAEGAWTGRFVALDIAALNTCENSGLIPHARHGAKGVFAFAVYVSKFEGTGLEKEHIVQIQVPLL